MAQPYDSAWKEALERHFLEFLELFFPHIAADIDWSRGHQLLDKELRQIASDAESGLREADVLVGVTRRDGGEAWVLVHVEIQTQQDANFQERMFVYHYRIYDRYQKPVCSLAVLGDRSPEWRPCRREAQLWGCRLLFEFPVVKLVDLRLEELERSSNPVGVLAAAHLHAQTTSPDSPQRRIVKLRLVRNLFEAGLSRDRIVEFFRLVDWVLRLSAESFALFRAELEAYEKEIDMPYITSIEEYGLQQGLKQGLHEGLQQGLHEGLQQGLHEGLQQGLHEGLQQGLHEGLVSVLEARFPPISDEIKQRLESIRDVALLRALTVSAATDGSLESFVARLGSEEV